MNDGEVMETLPATVRLAVSVEQAAEENREYIRLCEELLEPGDYQKIGQKLFKKKSAWRKLARAFNLADRVTFEHIERGADGFPLYARVRVETRAPNGRTAEADHECHVGERCCAARDGLDCPKARWDAHSCCSAGCDGRLHWSHPGDVPATALTRAKNRAIADLIGAGEVSAEELEALEAQRPRPAAAGPRPAPRTSTNRGTTEFWRSAMGLGFTAPQVAEIAGVTSFREWTTEQFAGLLAQLEAKDAERKAAERNGQAVGA